jgi:MSHA biogenesis protein MshO
VTPRTAQHRRRRIRGFTLIELIVVITLVSVIAVLISSFVIEPFLAFEDVQRRARLVDIADTALSRTSRELRLALPNSVRVASSGSLTALEFLRTRVGSRYRAQPTPAGAGDVLDFTTADTGVDLIGAVTPAPTPGELAVIYNLTATGPLANAYVGDNRTGIGAASTSAYLAFDPPFQFPLTSPSQRVYLVDTVVSYVCDNASGTLTRRSGYTIAAAQPVAAGDFAGGASGLVADRVQCTFGYNPGAGTRHGLVSLRLTVSEQGETVSLLRQVHVLNVP